MKTVISIFFFFFVTSILFNVSAQIYVNHAATGNNTGSTWADAYTDLQSALAAAPNGGSIWVAQGTYTPDTIGGSPEATFDISQDLVLYGGFFGDETSADDRNPEMYETILSGDLNGDDTPDDFANGKDDNVIHVLTVDVSMPDVTLIDGFTIVRGFAVGDPSSLDVDGGGMHCKGSGELTIKQCTFMENYAEVEGGAIKITASGDVAIENCLLKNNRANTGGAIMIAGNTNYIIKENEITNNVAFSGMWQANGGGVFLRNANGIIQDCMFNGNMAVSFGGGLFAWSTSNNNESSLELINCTFESNDAGQSGGGASLAPWGISDYKVIGSTFLNNTSNDYSGGLDLYTGESSNNVGFLVDNCLFEGNSAADFSGGGLSFWADGDNTDLTLTGCEFNGNIGGQDGGALAMTINQTSNNAMLNVNNCLFTENSCAFAGSGIGTQLAGINVNLEIDSCEFYSNFNADEAALNLWGLGGGTGTVVVDGCIFEDNVNTYPGALQAGNGWNGGASIGYTIRNCSLNNNEAMEGGAVGFWCRENSPTNILMDNCIIDGNTATMRGGGIEFWPLGENLNVTISRTKITNNNSPIGGAINVNVFEQNLPIFDNNYQIENCLIANNSSESAAIYLDSTTNFKLVNCTVTNNESNGIELSKESSLTLQNTILFNPNYIEYDALTNDVTVISIGGNLFGDLSLTAFAANTDQQDVDPLFVALDDFHLQDASPAIDKGFDSGNLPDYDLDGNDRINGCVDIGAYESDHTTGVECFAVSNKDIVDNETLSLSPNPALDVINITLPVTNRNHFEIEIYDSQGKLLNQKTSFSGQSIPVHYLSPGMYQVKVTEGASFYTGRFVKR